MATMEGWAQSGLVKVPCSQQTFTFKLIPFKLLFDIA